MPNCPLCTKDPRYPVWHRSIVSYHKRHPEKGQLVSRTATAQVVGGPPVVPGASPARPIDEAKAPAPGATPGPAAPGAPGAAPAPAEPKKKKLLSFLTRETSAIRTDVSKPKQEFDWILPEEANARIWSAGLSFLRQSLNLLNKFLGIKPIPDDVMRFGKADLDSINEAFRAPTSKLLYSAGFRTVESAVRFTLVFSGISLFGLMIVQIGIFYAEEIPKAPKLAAWRDRIRERSLAFRARTEEARVSRAAAQQKVQQPALPQP
ncbi:MAG: hypothetical protein ACREEC_04715 [Thermoplasmata archaeon]